MGKLTGKTAIVTGSGRGIGRAIALKLGAEGANLIVNDLDPQPAEEVRAALAAVGAKSHAVVGDVTAPSFPERIIAEALSVFGGVDVLINNAGYIWNTTIQKTSDEQWAAMMDVHATAPFRLLRAASGYIRDAAKREAEASGRAKARKVVNISSVAGTHGAPTMVAYSAGKAALIGITKSLSQEWGRFNVTVNSVAFGHIETRLTQPLHDGPQVIDVGGRSLKVGLSPADIEAGSAMSSLGRPGTAEEAAGAVYLFCIPESDFITGQVLECSGGFR